MKIKLKYSVIEAEVADDLIKRAIGLSLSEKKNMFFPMSYESRWSLWMFAVRYPIKMVFIGKDKRVIDIKKGVYKQKPDRHEQECIIYYEYKYVFGE